jgi:acetylglutamate/LysW-gamma-L-alpha-aminoadipate kinase
VDGDRAAAVLAAAFQAETLVILSNVPGLLRDVKDETSLIPHIHKARLKSCMEFAEGRMKKKVMGAMEALDSGVSTVVLGDARLEQPIQQALQGRGTVIH